MLFNSLIFIVFLVLTVSAYYLLPAKMRWCWLLIASIGYYLSFIPVFLGLVVVLALVNFFLSGQLAKAQGNRSQLLFAIILIINIGSLAFFKYFTKIFTDVQLHFYQVDFLYKVDPINSLILPLGLSYIIFTVLSYQIEIRRKSIDPEPHLGYFSLYLLFFPKIAQGPIERPQNLLPQFRQTRDFNYDTFVEGLKMILMGYFKKLVIADRLAIYVNTVYSNSEHHNGTTLLIATVFFAFQIYADFSGYTDIALGSAKLFGFNLTNNFRRPYLASSVKDFWDRWHISFSTWLRDYIFLPLAYFFAHKMTKTEYFRISAEKWIYSISILATFIVCGIWHGVGMTFLLWGIIFGLYLSFSNSTRELQKRIRKRLNIKKNSAGYRIYSIILTFALVLFAWIFFKAATVPEAFNIIGKIFTTPGSVFFQPSEMVFAIIAIGSLIAIDLKHEFLQGRFAVLHNNKAAVRMAGIALMVIMVLLLGVFDGGQFIYFQF